MKLPVEPPCDHEPAFDKSVADQSPVAEPPAPPAEGTEIFPESVAKPSTAKSTGEDDTGEVDTGVPTSGSVAPDCDWAGVWYANNAAPAINVIVAV